MKTKTKQQQQQQKQQQQQNKTKILTRSHNKGPVKGVRLRHLIFTAIGAGLIILVIYFLELTHARICP